MSDLAQEMHDLAEAAARDHALDFTLASLDKLEAIIRPCSIDVATTRSWGAYLGETLRRQRPDVARWIDYDTAVKAASIMRELAPGPDLAAVLQIADRLWFPLSKVEKFQTNGDEDSLAGFAAAALAFAPVIASPEEAERDRAYRASEDAALDAAAKTLLPDLSGDNVCRLASAFRGRTPRRLYGEALRRIGLTVDHLMPLLGEASHGRKWTFHPGRDAADLIATLLHTGVAPREATTERLRAELGSRSKTRRMYAAFALAYSELQAGRTEATVELLHAGDRAAVDGAWEAFALFSGLVRLGHVSEDPAPMLQRLAPDLCAALVDSSPHVSRLLDALQSWSFAWERRADLSLFIPVLLALLAGKPAIAAQASGLLEGYVWALVHGRAPRDERVEVLRGRRGFERVFARLDGARAMAPKRTVDEWMELLQSREGALATTPADDEESLEVGPDSCSPRYGQFLRTYGAVRIVGEREDRLVIQADVEEQEIGEYELLRFATDEGRPVYFLCDDLLDDDEAPVVTLSNGALEHHGEFEDWLRAAFERLVGA